MKKIEDVLAEHEQHLMGTPGVVGVGIGERQGRPVVLVMLNGPAAEIRKSLPRDLEGYPVELETSGEVTAF